MNRDRDFSLAKSENLLNIWSRAFTPVMSKEPASRPETRYRGKGSTPVKIFRYLGV
jgi:hypothetical protein